MTGVPIGGITGKKADVRRFPTFASMCRVATPSPVVKHTNTAAVQAPHAKLAVDVIISCRFQAFLSHLYDPLMHVIRKGECEDTSSVVRENSGLGLTKAISAGLKICQIHGENFRSEQAHSQM